MFYNNCTGQGDDISSKNEIIFSSDNTILENINFYEYGIQKKSPMTTKKIFGNICIHYTYLLMKL